jgi:hypothetical protein
MANLSLSANSISFVREALTRAGSRFSFVLTVFAAVGLIVAIAYVSQQAVRQQAHERALNDILIFANELDRHMAPFQTLLNQCEQAQQDETIKRLVGRTVNVQLPENAQKGLWLNASTRPARFEFVTAPCTDSTATPRESFSLGAYEVLGGLMEGLRFKRVLLTSDTATIAVLSPGVPIEQRSRPNGVEPIHPQLVDVSALLAHVGETPGALALPAKAATAHTKLNLAGQQFDAYIHPYRPANWAVRLPNETEKSKFPAGRLYVIGLNPETADWSWRKLIYRPAVAVALGFGVLILLSAPLFRLLNQRQLEPITHGQTSLAIVLLPVLAIAVVVFVRTIQLDLSLVARWDAFAQNAGKALTKRVNSALAAGVFSLDVDRAQACDGGELVERFSADIDGKVSNKHSVDCQRPSTAGTTFQVSDRAYFTLAKDACSDASAARYALQRVESRLNGEKRYFLAKAHCETEETVRVAVMKLRALRSPVLMPGLSFLLVDAANGTIIAATDDSSALRRSVLDTAHAKVRLAPLLRSNAQRCTNLWLNGEPQRVCGISWSTPIVDAMALKLLVHYRLGPLTRAALHAAAITMIGGAIALVTSLMLLLAVGAATRRSRGASAFVIMLWPQARLSRVYVLWLLVLIVQCATLVWLLKQPSHAFPLRVLLILPTLLLAQSMVVMMPPLMALKPYWRLAAAAALLLPIVPLALTFDAPAAVFSSITLGCSAALVTLKVLWDRGELGPRFSRNPTAHYPPRWRALIFSDRMADNATRSERRVGHFAWASSVVMLLIIVGLVPAHALFSRVSEQTVTALLRGEVRQSIRAAIACHEQLERLEPSMTIASRDAVCGTVKMFPSGRIDLPLARVPTLIFSIQRALGLPRYANATAVTLPGAATRAPGMASIEVRLGRMSPLEIGNFETVARHLPPALFVGQILLLFVVVSLVGRRLCGEALADADAPARRQPLPLEKGIDRCQSRLIIAMRESERTVADALDLLEATSTEKALADAVQRLSKNPVHIFGFDHLVESDRERLSRARELLGRCATGSKLICNRLPMRALARRRARSVESELSNESAELMLWAELLWNAEVQAGAPIQPVHRAASVGYVERVERETRAFWPMLKPLRDRFFSNAVEYEPLPAAELAERIEREAYPVFVKNWLLLTLEERRVLALLARGWRLALGNSRTVETLLRIDALGLEPDPRIKSHALQRFLMDIEPPELIQKWEADAEVSLRDGRRATLLAFAAIAMVVLSFGFYEQLKLVGGLLVGLLTALGLVSEQRASR